MDTFRSSLSHVIIPVGSQELYKSVVQFYQNLGFTIVSYKPEKFDAWLIRPPIDISCNSSVPETSLTGNDHDVHLQRNFSSQICDLSQALYAVFRVVYSEHHPIKRAEEVKKRAETVAREENLHYPLFVIVSPDIEEHKRQLDNQNWAYSTKPCNPPILRNKLYSVCSDRTIKDKNGTVSLALHTCDPAGNWIVICNRCCPFDGTVSTLYKSEEPEPLYSPEKIQADQVSVCILTSGGDAPGMNGAVRSSVRTALQNRYIAYISQRGYKGLVNGKEYIVKTGWDDVRTLQSVGGTSIGTDRCKEFTTREGRLSAALNLIQRNVSSLIVIGGDGSLTGANILRQEWTSLIDELCKMGKLKKEELSESVKCLKVIGIVGSIDNDMALTDFTVGAFTSLHRICECLDALISTALSHRRAFVVEVMGRKCGWLALMTAVAVGAHYVFLPERPPPINKTKYGANWKAEICDIVKKSRELNNHKTLIIVAEGAIDMNLNPIKSEDVKRALEEALNLDTRVTCLGHIQRGGSPCAYDRYLATVQGARAIDIIKRNSSASVAKVVGIKENRIVEVDLMKAVEMTHALSKAIDQKNFDQAFDLRGNFFKKIYQAFLETCGLRSFNFEPPTYLPFKYSMRIAIVTVGAPAGGVNASVRSAARLIIKRGGVPLGVKNGMLGLANGLIEEISWVKTIGMQVKGGSLLGTSRIHPRPLYNSPEVYPKAEAYVECGIIAFNMQKYNINALIFIGGFEALTSQLILTDARRTFPAFRIPFILIPATISNNIPLTDFSLGCDTALNVIAEACDRIKLSAEATKDRVYVIETQGGKCGYLATISGLISGAHKVYIPEVGITLKSLCDDFDFIRAFSKYTYTDFSKAGNGRIILISDGVSKTYTSGFICKTFKEYLEGQIDIKSIVLGHLQQGGIPSPFDRLLATFMTYSAIEYLNEDLKSWEQCTSQDTLISEYSSVVGTNVSCCYREGVFKVIDMADIKQRRPKNMWWNYIMDLISYLNKYKHEDYYKIKTYPSNISIVPS